MVVVQFKKSNIDYLNKVIQKMLIQAKSNLARLMASENLIVEERNVATASFDPKNRILTVPILNGNLSANVYDLLLGHEVGHALETPADGWHDSVVNHKVEKTILNVCEDVRIEKKIKRRFPGLKSSFIKGYNELMEMDFFGTKNVNLNELNFIDRVNLFTKSGSATNIKFSEKEQSLLNEIESTETFQEVIGVAKKVQAFMKVAAQEKSEISKKKVQAKVEPDDGDGDQEEPGQAQSVESSEAEPSDKSKSSATTEEADSQEFDVDEYNKESSKFPEKEETKNEVEDQKSSGRTAGSGRAKPNMDNLDIESKTDRKFHEQENKLFAAEKCDTIYSNIPKVSIDNLIIDYATVLKTIFDKTKQPHYQDYYRPATLLKNFNKFKSESNKVVSYLVKEFELRKNAEQQSRVKVSKTGELNMAKLYDYKLTDDIFRRMSVVPNGKSHGLVMYIDWSGSMIKHINATIKQLMNLVLFCKKVNIPFEVYAFTTQWSDKNDYYYSGVTTIQTPKIGDLFLGANFRLMNLLSNRMTAKQFTDMASFLLDIGTDQRRFTSNFIAPDEFSMGGTPLNHSIVSAFEIVEQFKNRNKVQIVNTVFLTDGESGSLDGRFSYINNYGKLQASTDHRPSSKRRAFFRDPVTFSSVEISRDKRGFVAETEALMTLLKERTQSNILGFYVTSGREARSAFNIYCDFNGMTITEQNQKVEKMLNEFRKEKSLILDGTAGYDKYYVIKSDTLDTDDIEDFEIKENATTKNMVNAFSKYNQSKLSSRVILNSFIKMIA